MTSLIRRRKLAVMVGMHVASPLSSYPSQVMIQRERSLAELEIILMSQYLAQEKDVIAETMDRLGVDRASAKALTFHQRYPHQCSHSCNH